MSQLDQSFSELQNSVVDLLELLEECIAHDNAYAVDLLLPYIIKVLDWMKDSVDLWELNPTVMNAMAVSLLNAVDRIGVYESDSNNG